MEREKSNLFQKNIIFGPVFSRRFGKSLGIDLSPWGKQCNFDCLYCELENKRAMKEMREIIDVNTIIENLFLYIKPDIDVLTITANGEPTLYPHLLELITKLKILLPKQIKTLILSNGSRFNIPEVQEALKKIDIVKFSLDAGIAKSFLRVDRPHKDIDLDSIKSGLLNFSQSFQGELIAEVLFVKGINDDDSNVLALSDFFALLTNLSRIDIGTIDRPPAHPKEPIEYERLEAIAKIMQERLHVPINIPARKPTSHQNPQSTNSLSNYDLRDTEIYNLIQHRPIEINEAKKEFSQKTIEKLSMMLKEGKIFLRKNGNLTFYSTRKN